MYLKLRSFIVIKITWHYFYLLEYVIIMLILLLVIMIMINVILLYISLLNFDNIIFYYNFFFNYYTFLLYFLHFFPDLFNHHSIFSLSLTIITIFTTFPIIKTVTMSEFMIFCNLKYLSCFFRRYLN